MFMDIRILTLFYQRKDMRTCAVEERVLLEVIVNMIVHVGVATATWSLENVVP